MNKLRSTLSTAKAQIRQNLRTGQDLFRGYGYARVQTAPIADGYLWGECTTPIKQRAGADVNENRLWNMDLAARQWDGLVLEPGQYSGFWNRVPQPTIANGFRAGPMLIRGKLTLDVGGGLCQISTTLFQAFLRADLQIVERHNHSIDAHGSDRFFTLGQDATVAYGYKDLIACNPHPVPIQVRLQVDAARSQVTASLWSSQPMPHEVRIESTVREELSPNDDRGKSGWLVETTRFAPEDRITYHALDTYHPYAPA